MCTRSQRRCHFRVGQKSRESIRQGVPLSLNQAAMESNHCDLVPLNADDVIADKRPDQHKSKPSYHVGEGQVVDYFDRLEEMFKAYDDKKANRELDRQCEANMKKQRNTSPRDRAPSPVRLSSPMPLRSGTPGRSRSPSARRIQEVAGVAASAVRTGLTRTLSFGNRARGGA